MKKELLGIDKINAVLNKFLEPFEAYADLGEEFSYWYTDSRIEYNLVVIEASTDYFMQNFNRMAPDLNCDPFLASFLHELGHHETLDFIDDDYKPIKASIRRRFKTSKRIGKSNSSSKIF